MLDELKQSEDVANAISVLRTRIETIHTTPSGDKAELLDQLDAIEFGTMVFSSFEEQVGFNDFMGCFVHCNYESHTHRLDWAKGYLRASKTAHLLNNKQYYKGCHFDDAEIVVQRALASDIADK